MIFARKIIDVALGEDELLKNVEFDSEDLADGEELAGVDSVVVKAADSRWETLTATTDFTAQSNGSSGTVAQVKITKAAAAGRYVITVTATTTLGQVLVANCRVIVS